MADDPLQARRRKAIARPPQQPTKTDVIWYIVVAQIVLVLAGLTGAGLHTFPLSIHAEHEDYPVVDIVTIAWLGVALIGALLPRISEVTFGEASLKLREATEGAGFIKDSLNDVANLVQNWSTSAMLYITLLESAQSEDRKALLLSNYLRDRMGEAKSFLADSAESNVRIALWIYDPESDKIAFYFSNEVRPTQASWEPGEGLIGQAWLESRRFNEPDVRSVPGYKSTRNEDPPYKAVICVPVRRGYDTIGMLTADKDEETIFSEVADDIATGLAAQCAFALDQYGKLA